LNEGRGRERDLEREADGRWWWTKTDEHARHEHHVYERLDSTVEALPKHPE
jgi:hypothetical protein